MPGGRIVSSLSRWSSVIEAWKLSKTSRHGSESPHFGYPYRKRPPGQTAQTARRERYVGDSIATEPEVPSCRNCDHRDVGLSRDGGGLRPDGPSPDPAFGNVLDVDARDLAAPRAGRVDGHYV